MKSRREWPPPFKSLAVFEAVYCQVYELCGPEFARICSFCIENPGLLRRNSLPELQHKPDMEESRVKLRIAVIAVLCIGLFCSVSMLSNQTYAQGKRAASDNGPVVMPKITVLNPMGTPPPITLIPQAPRLSTLDGKTIYFINTGYIGTDRLMSVMMDWFKANYPKTTLVYRDNKGGAGLAEVSKALWTEMTEKADASIVGLGH
jgi:hypothetical protein